MDGIDLAADNDPDALVKVRPYLPAMGSILSPANPQLTLVRVRVTPDLAKVRRVNLELTYNTEGANFTPTVYLLRDRTFSMRQTRCTIPGTRELIVIGFDAPVGIDFQPNLAPGPIYFDLDVSVRSIQLTVLMYGRPSGGSADYHNYVNHANWPTGNVSFGPVGSQETATPLPIGYWRLAQYATEFNRNAGMTLVQSEALTQVTEDWSVVGMLRNEKTGKYPFASLYKIDNAAYVAALNLMTSAPYVYGRIYPTGTQPQRGLTRFGPHQLVDFQGLFGF